MKKCIVISILLCAYFHSFVQNQRDFVDDYISKEFNKVPVRLNHDPVQLLDTGIDNANLFFISVFDSIHDTFHLQGVLYQQSSNLFLEFYKSEFDPSFSKGVITVFFENIDIDVEKEMLFIVKNANRTFYSDGGYAGIKPIYQTKVFNVESSQGSIKISEYKAIGELLTVNTPIVMGSKTEEQIMGRESMKLDEILGVTNCADAVKRRIKMLTTNGLLK